MRHIIIFSIGKTREPWLKSALDEYEKRATGQWDVEWVLLAKDSELEKTVLADKKEFIALDPCGKSVTSLEFAHLFLAKATTRFVIGGAEGLTPRLKNEAKTLLSLSPLTFTHQITRLVLLEQVYRSIQIELGTEYHK